MALDHLKEKNYIKKFNVLTNNIITNKERNRFLKSVQNLRKIKSGHLYNLNLEVRPKQLKKNSKKGIF